MNTLNLINLNQLNKKQMNLSTPYLVMLEE